MELKTRLNINDRVEIIELGRSGSVVEISYDGVNLTYSVRYFDNGHLCAVPFYDSELRRIESGSEE